MKTYAMHNPPARQENDLYCTNPIAVQMLLDREKFSENIWEWSNRLLLGGMG